MGATGTTGNPGGNGGAQAGGGGGGGGGGAAGVLSTTNSTVTINAGSSVTGGSGGNGGIGDASSTAGGGGGGGGGQGVLTTSGGSLSNAGTIIGGSGGTGGAAGAGSAGGSGGAGGDGVAATGATPTQIVNSNVISGGSGGTGAAAGPANAGNNPGGNGGSGGAGISGTNLTITNSGTITGGNGAAGGAATGAGAPGAVGNGGEGIRGSNLTIVNSGSISGGFAGDGVTRANAITFTGGTNSLEIDAGSTITGVVAGTGTNTLVLGGAANSTFDVSQIAPAGNTSAQYQNFSSFQKTGTSTWQLTNSTTAVTPWTISAGTLQVSADGNLGATAGTLTLDGGTLEATSTFSTSRNMAITASNGTIQADPGTTLTASGTISGVGGLTQTGTGTLTLSGANTYTGATTISAGTLALSGTGSIAASSGVAVASAGSFDISGTSAGASVLTLSGSGNVVLGAQTLTLTNANDTFNGVIGGSGGLTVTGGSETLGSDGSVSYTGPTTVSNGATLILAPSGTRSPVGSTTMNVNGPSTLVFQAMNAEDIRGTIAFDSVGGGTVDFTGSTHNGGVVVSGALTISASGGNQDSVISTSGIGLNLNFRGLTLNTAGPTSSLLVSSFLWNSGTLVKTGPGTAILTANNAYTGTTTVSAGALFINGDQTAATGATTVASGATLGGTGTLGGNVSVANGGTLAPGGVGGSIGTLTINGNLGLNTGSILNYSFGQPNVAGGPLNDLTAVGGNLTLAGTLNVTQSPGGTFGPGVYRVLSYGGTLTDNGLALGTLPAGTTALVQTSVPNQVNLVNTTGVTVNYWDGAATANKNNGLVDGGSGAWQSSAGNDNWTNASGTLNAPVTNLPFAIFQATPGTVTVDNSVGQVSASGMQFASNGYVINGGPLTLVETTPGSGATTIRVGDGTAVGAGYTATIDAVLQGSVQLEKSDLGTLVLTGANTYTGGTAINGGTLQVSADNNLGATTGALSFDGGTLAVTGAGFTSARSTTLNAGGGTIDVAPAGMLTMNGVIGGTGALTKTNAGTLVLAGTNTYAGGTAINGGTLQVSADSNLGATTGGLSFDGGTLAVTGSGFSSARATTLNSGGGTFDIAPAATLTMSGVIGGAGSLTKADAGTLVLTGTNTYSGGTTISAGTLQLGNGGASGSIVGDVANNGTLAFNRSDAYTFGGVVSGTGALTQMGTGATVLTGASTYSGPTTVQTGTLIVNGSIVSSVTVLPAGTLAGSGIVGSVVNQGVVWTGNPVIGDTGYGALTIRGNYSDPQGQVVFNTFLGSDGSPSSRLILDGGTTSGTSTVVVHPTGTNGALTQNNGIQLVQAVNGATTGAQAFVMPGELRAGAFSYRLFQGGTNGSAPNDWFLRSHFTVAPVEPSVIPPLTALPVDPPPATLDPGRYPIIGPELATYGAVQPLARQLGLTTLGTLHERIGNTLDDTQGGSGSAGWGRSGWGRIFGQQIDNRYQAFTAPGTSGSLLGFQTGIDLWRGSTRPGHHDAAGVYFAYGNSSVSVDGLVTNAAATAYERGHTGSVSLDGYTGGAYWTHYGPGGWYVDAVFQGTSYDGHASTQFARLPVSGSGFATSLEGGYPMALAFGPGFVLEPQVQLIWQHVSLSESNDGQGSVDLGSTSGGTGRIGVRGQWTIERNNGQVWQPYVRTNLWRDWGAQATTTFSGVNQVPLSQQATRMDVAAGFTAKLATRMSVYGQFGYQFSINSSESGQRKGVWGDIGIRYTW